MTVQRARSPRDLTEPSRFNRRAAVESLMRRRLSKPPLTYASRPLGKLVRRTSTRVQGFHVASGICLAADFSKATPS
jgi:hypothetical protein